MNPIGNEIMTSFRAALKEAGVAERFWNEHLKWLRYFLDFSVKYGESYAAEDRLGPFLDKLRQKGQSDVCIRQATYAVSLYLSTPAENEAPVNSAPTPPPQTYYRASLYDETGYREKSDSPEWDEVLTRLAGAIKVRH